MTRSFTSLYSRLTVERVTITVEAVDLPGRGLVAIELAKPRPRFAIVHEDGPAFEIVSVHEDEDEAVSTCKRLVDELQKIAGGAAGPVLQ